MLTASKQFSAFVRSQTMAPAGYIKVQMPTKNGSSVASQLVFDNIVSFSISRNEEPSSDAASFVMLDSKGIYASTSTTSPYGAAFTPGEIDKKFLLYIGYRGAVNPGTGFVLNAKSLQLLFTGFLETDQQKPEPFTMEKTVNLIDNSKQFRFQVYDSFPHPLAGNQTASWYDPTYNLTNPSADGVTWVCDGKMFTLSRADKVFGSTHVDVAVYVDTTGGSSPATTPLSPTAYTFDYKNGVVVLNSPVAANSVVSVAGNPTYMAPEVMIRKILIEKANYDPRFVNLEVTNQLLPQYNGDNKQAWQCLTDIAALTNPRMTPWNIRVDFNGVVHFYESRLDSPPTKTYLDGRDLFTAEFINSARDIRTVVRADATCVLANGADQPIVSISYDLKAITRSGLTEPLNVDSRIAQSVRHLPSTYAVSYLNIITGAALIQASRPVLTLQADVWPDLSTEIGDTVRVRSKKTGIDTYMTVKGIDLRGDPTAGLNQTVRLEELPEYINFASGVPSAVSAGGSQQAVATAAPSTSLIGAVRMGNGALLQYPVLNGQFNENSKNEKPIVPTWNADDSSPMHFDIFLNPAPAVPQAPAPPTTGSDYTHLPPGYAWVSETNANGDVVWYCQNDGAGYVLYVGPDSVFYRYNRGGDYHFNPATDSGSIWNPNTAPLAPALGGSFAYAIQTSTTYVWSWWYLCLDSNQGPGKSYRPVVRLDPSSGGVGRSVPGGGLWVNNSVSGGPVPNGTASYTKYYGNVVVGCTDYTSPPPGFVGANVHNDGYNIGVAFGADALAGTTYVGYQKRTRAHFCIYAANNLGAVQFLRIPFAVLL